jgi:hypothetical protein
MTQTTSYEQQAIDFLQSTNTEFSATYLRSGKYFDDDKETRDVYQISLKRGTRIYSFEFGQSINDSGFYYQHKTGKTKFPLDRKYLSNEYKGKVLSHIKMKDSSFVPNLDIIHYPKQPTAYDVLACLTKNEVGTFEDFCSEFGYDTDSKKAEKTYNAVVNEYLNVCKLFTDAEIEQLQEIS